jgi:membrane protein YqaA with SNARE-associated domain
MIIGCHRLIAPIIVDRGFSLVVKPTRQIDYDDRKCQTAPETANIMNETGALFGLFLSAFLAATILPAQSELGLGYLVITSQYSMGLLVLFASLGNTLGAIVNWVIGRSIESSVIRIEKIKVSPRYQSVARWYQKFGRWTLLLSWVPIIGDPITVMAGIFKEPLKSFVLIVALAKTTRYVVIALFAEKFAFG